MSDFHEVFPRTRAVPLSYRRRTRGTGGGCPDDGSHMPDAGCQNRMPEPECADAGYSHAGSSILDALDATTHWL